MTPPYLFACAPRRCLARCGAATSEGLAVPHGRAGSIPTSVSRWSRVLRRSSSCCPSSRRGPPRPPLIRHTLAVLLFLIAAGCSGGGCSSGCSSCSGITPLAGGFDVTKRIENGGSARIPAARTPVPPERTSARWRRGLLGASSDGRRHQLQASRRSRRPSAAVSPLTSVRTARTPTGTRQISATPRIDIGNASLTDHAHDASGAPGDSTSSSPGSIPHPRSGRFPF